jgi:phage gpG-like protein
MDIKVTVSGLENLITNVANIQAKTGSAGNVALERVALLMRDTVVKYAGAGHPDNPNVITGRLRSSIQYQMISDNEAFVGSNVDYAPYVEFGHAQTPGRYVPAIGKRLVQSVVPAYPFFRPAITDVFDGGQATKLYEASMRELLGL